MQFYQSEGCANALTLLADTELVLACSGGSLSVLPADARGTGTLARMDRAGNTAGLFCAPPAPGRRSGSLVCPARHGNGCGRICIL